MKLDSFQTLQVQDLDRLIATIQDNCKRVFDLLTGSPFAAINVVSVAFPDSEHPTTHGDGTTGYDVLVAHGLGVVSPKLIPTTLQQLAVAPGLTTADMGKAIITISPDNTAKNQNPLKSILLTCSQPSVLSQVVFF